MHQKEEKKLQEKEAKMTQNQIINEKNLAGEEEEDCNFQKHSNQEIKKTHCTKSLL
jgi:hypothetical protein